METPPSPTESLNYKINELLTQIMDRVDVVDFHEKMLTLVQKIKEKYPDYNKYRVYHKLIGSTPMDGLEYIDKDFEGNCSVVAFLEGLIDQEKNKSAL